MKAMTIIACEKCGTPVLTEQNGQLVAEGSVDTTRADLDPKAGMRGTIHQTLEKSDMEEGVARLNDRATLVARCPACGHGHTIDMKSRSGRGIDINVDPNP